MEKYDEQARLETAARLIANAGSLLITAGAGMGVDSGLPDFRGVDGFWRAYPALGKQGLSFPDIANGAAFQETLRLAWGFYGHRLNLYRNTEPHEGFQILKKWVAAMSGGGGIFTSNVDGHFQKAGFAGVPIQECHGSIHYLQCRAGCSSDIWSAKQFFPDVDESLCQLRGSLPCCPHCGEVARPNILMFDDWCWREERTLYQGIALQQFLDTSDKLVVIELGAGKAIAKVRHTGQRVSARHRGFLIRINPTDFTVPREQDVGIALGALEGLKAIDRILTGAAVN